MANSLTPLIVPILAKGLDVLRTRVLMTQLVNLDYSEEAKEKGDTIDIPISSAQSVTDVTPSHVPSAPSDSTLSKVQIQLNNWKKTNFHLTDNDLQKIQAQGNGKFMPLQMDEAFQAIAAAINDSVFAEYTGVYGYTGTANPFSADVSAATQANKVLNQQLAPRMNRRGVVDFATEADALALAQFSDAEKVGSSEVKIEGEIGRKFGIDWFADNAVPTHTKGSEDGAYVTSGAASVGASSVTLATGSGNIEIGDVVTFAGDTQTYVATAQLTGPGALSISPTLQVAQSGGEAVTVKDSHAVNLAFHRDAFALAMRAPDAGLKEVAARDNSFTMSDPQTGLVLRLELMQQYKQVTWEVDALWGVKLVRPELAVRIAG